MVKVIHYAVVGILALGAIYYLWATPPSLNPLVDRQGAEALALVQTHRALGYPTILQAMTEHVRSMKERGKGSRLGEWRVKAVDGDIYEIRIQLRDEGLNGQWFEREFIWHANLQLKKINAASLPADGVTPKEPDPISSSFFNSAASVETYFQLAGSATRTKSPSIRTWQQSTVMFWFPTRSPVQTLNSQPCQGHSTTWLVRWPSPNGPPACGQVLSMA